MRFLDKLRERFGPDYDKNELIKVAQAGERLEGIAVNGSFDVLMEEILEPMRKECFDVFTKLDPGDVNGIIQAQKMAQIISEIERRMRRKIELGVEARRQLLSASEDSTPKEGE